MTEQTVPHDLDTERALLGGLFLANASQRSLVLDALVPADFYGDSTHRHLFCAIQTMHRRGDRVDLVVARDELRRTGTHADEDELLAVQRAGSSLNLEAYVDTLTRLAVARQVLERALEVADQARAAKLGPSELIDLAREHMNGIDAPLTDAAALAGLSTMAEFLDTARTDPAPWVIPGLLRRGWRCLLVAPEGVGKSVAFRQIAGAAAAGVHPFAHTDMPPVRTLIIDLENPDDAITETAQPIHNIASRVGGYDPQRAHLWRRPDGIDLRARTDRAAFHRVLEQVQPDLVCLGPLYKAYRVKARENDEIAAAEVQAVLDDARTRHGFALLMEHHAPKAQGLGGRDLVPYGSSLWLRWPELGLKLVPGDGERVPSDSLSVGRFRRDRMKNKWPDRLDRGKRWPWDGWWQGGGLGEPVVS